MLSLAQELHTFENGEVADAQKINENFDSLQSRLDALEDRLLPGFEGSTQTFDADCAQNPNALEEILTASLANDARVRIIIDGNCLTSGIYAFQGQSITIIGDDPTEDKLVGAGPAWSVVFAQGEIRLLNITVVKYAGHRSGAYAWRGGSLYLINVRIEAPAEVGDSSSFYCVNAELGSIVYIDGLTCNSYSKGVGLSVASGAWIRGAINIAASATAISAQDGSAFRADRVHLNATGGAAIYLGEKSSFAQKFSNGDASYVINGDVYVESGSVIRFIDELVIEHTSGQVTATDATLELRGFTTPTYTLERSSGFLEPANDAANITARGSTFELVAPDSQNPSLHVDLINSTVQYIRGNGPNPNSFNCSGFSNVEVDGAILELPGTGKCAVQEQ